MRAPDRVRPQAIVRGQTALHRLGTERRDSSHGATRATVGRIGAPRKGLKTLFGAPGLYRAHMDHQGHYAEAFCPLPGRCFRLVCSDVAGAQGSPRHCPLPVTSSGRYKDSRGRWHNVEACSIHSEGVADLRPLVGR
jgi:hypothetical protein